MTTTFENAKVGDRVWSFIAGWGVICKIVNNSAHPIRVYFDRYDAHYSFTWNGYFTHKRPIPVLFWDEIKFEVPEQPPREKLIHGVKVPDFSFIPENREYYYAPDVSEPSLYCRFTFYNDENDKQLLKHNLCYPYTEEGRQAAILHAKAMLGIKE